MRCETEEEKTTRLSFLHAEPFLRRLRAHGRELSTQQYKTLKGQALSGDLAGAEAGLKKLTKYGSGA